MRGKSDKTKPAYTLYTQALKRPQTKPQKHSAENQKTVKQSMHNNSYRGRYRRWREALLKNKTISEEDDTFLSGYQK